MQNFDKYVKKHNFKDKNWLFRMLIIGPSGSGKTNALLNIIQDLNNNTPVDKIYLYAKDLSEQKYKYLIDVREKAGLKYLKDSAAFIEYSNDMDDVFTNIDNYNPTRNRKILIIFDDIAADIMSKKEYKAIIKELLIRCRKLNISLVFIMQSYFRTPKDARLNSTHYLLTKINNKKELQNIADDNSADLEYKDFLKLYRHFTSKPYSFMIIDETLPSNDPNKYQDNFIY